MTDDPEGLLESILEAAPAGVGVLDRHLRFVHVNGRLAQLTHLAAEAYVGHTIAEVLPAIASAVEPPLRRVLESGWPLTDLGVSIALPSAPHGQRHWRIDGFAFTSQSGERLGVTIAVTDRTDERNTEELRSFFTEANAVLGSSLDYETTLAVVARLVVPRFADWCAVDIVEDDGTIRRLAVAARDPDTEALVRETRVRYPFDPNEAHGVPWVIRTGQPELLSEISEQDLAEHAVSEGHLDILRRLGLTSLVRVPLIARGRTLGALSLVSTHWRRRYDRTSVGLTQVLAHRAALAVDNARLYHEAQEALRIREEFITALSHDLRTPLTPIKAFAQLLRQRVTRADKQVDAVVLEGLAAIDASATRMQRLAEQLIDVTRLQGGRQLELEERPTDLIGLVRHTVETQAGKIDHHQMRLDTALTSLVGRWDPDRIERVIANLIGNAVKYSPSGGEIRVRIWQDNGPDEATRWAVLSVEDQGIGIPAADLPHVLELYHRGRNVGAISGTGIGLAGAARIVEQHGGTITVESTEGRGTTVVVRLPLA